MSNLPARQQKKNQLVRTGYLGVGIGAVLFVLAILTTSWILGIFGLVVLGIAAWLTTIFRGA